jgi:hypothetical protein
MGAVKFRRGLTLQREESLGVVVDRFSFRRRQQVLAVEVFFDQLAHTGLRGESPRPLGRSCGDRWAFFVFATVYSLLYKVSA